MPRKLFCQLCPLTYQIAVIKNRLVRGFRNIKDRKSFASARGDELLPVVIYSHNSLIRRKLGNTNPELQDNKAQNLAISTPLVNKILIKPGETFSFWHLVGNTTAKKGYKKGVVIKGGKSDAGVGGGMCQFTNLIHWMVLHTPLTITEHHHHDGFDLFPDFNRQVPFGTGTSIFYNYLDYRFKNDTENTYQIVVYTTDTHLCGELRAQRPLGVKYHVVSKNERFVRVGKDVFRKGQVWRTCIDKKTGRELSRELLRENNALVLYDTSLLEIQ